MMSASGEDRIRTSPEASDDVDGRLSAIGALIRRDPSRVLDLASRLRGSGAEIECRLRGASMGRAIPPGSLVRVRLSGAATQVAGDVVAVVHDSSLCVHRVVHRGRTARARDQIVTQGDACLCPDPPVGPAQLLGTVTGMSGDGTWVPAPPRAADARAGSRVSGALLAVIALLLEVDPRLAALFARLATSIADALPHRDPVGGFPLRRARRDDEVDRGDG